MATRGPSRGTSLWLLVILLVALTFGAAAALLAGPATPFTPTPPGQTQPLPYPVLELIFGWSTVALVGLWVVLHLIERRRSGSAAIPGRLVVSFLVAFLLIVAFIVIVRSGILGPGVLSPEKPVGGNNSNGQNVTPTGVGNNTTLPGFGSIPFAGWQIPGWLFFVLLIGVAVAAVVVGVPLAAALRQNPLRASGPPATAPRVDFTRALAALEDSASADVRAIIVALYARLLGRIGPTLERVEAMSPREIEAECVHRLRIRPGTARDLTALFEEARYSNHTLSAPTLSTARRVFAQAIDDLDHPPGLL